ncbi:MAG: hypothetical protein LBJ58_04860, partial [Tannerellaceae bacterium]|nr:hypothetical protein [Tannerellaceae bacterium]
MRRYYLWIAFAAISLAAGAQVGINTENPAGLFHVATDKDFVISNSGNVGIGTTSPAAKLDVRGAVRIVDGLEAPGLMLTSDSVGNSRWALPTLSGDKIVSVQELPAQTFQPDTYTPVPASVYGVKSEGYHVFEIRWYAKYAVPSRHIHTATHFRLVRKDAVTQTSSVVDEYEMYRNITTNAADAITIWTTLSTYANAGDTLSLVVRPSIAHSAV